MLGGGWLCGLATCAAAATIRSESAARLESRNRFKINMNRKYILAPEMAHQDECSPRKTWLQTHLPLELARGKMKPGRESGERRSAPVESGGPKGMKDAERKRRQDGNRASSLGRRGGLGRPGSRLPYNLAGSAEQTVFDNRLLCLACPANGRRVRRRSPKRFMAVKRHDPQQVHLEQRQAKRGCDLHPSTT